MIHWIQLGLGVLLAVLLVLNNFEEICLAIFPHQDILRDGTQDLYLRRFFIYPRNKDFSENKLKKRIYLHKFYRGDEDQHLHTHPWPYSSLILTHGYWEETPDEEGNLPGGANKCYTIGPGWEKRTQKWYKPLSFIHRPAEWAHRVILDGPTKQAWTLVRTGLKERSWGFIIDGEQCPWQRYDGRVGVCTDPVPEGDNG